MPSLIDAATAILSSSERRIELISQNIANLQSPAYKAQVMTAALPENSSKFADFLPSEHIHTRLEQGKLSETGNPLDLAILGPGFFLVRSDSGMAFTRDGSFRIEADGELINGQGMVLQQVGGGDVRVDGPSFTVSETGEIVKDGQLLAAIGVYEVDNPGALIVNRGGGFQAADANFSPAENSVVRQGMRETSNVVMSDEMVALMAASRMAESGAQVVRLYDQLMGQAISTFSAGAR